MSSTNWKKIIGLRYMERFQCIGPDCEETCCANWNINVDDKHFHLLERLLPAEELTRNLRRLEKRSKSAFAMMALDEHKRCQALDADKLCSLQRRHGEAALPDTCAVYPRSLRGFGKRLEVYASLSCPEAARLALLGGPDAVEYVDMTLAQAGRAIPQLQVTGQEGYGWFGLLDRVRHGMLGTMRQRQHSLAGRWFALTAFAHQTREYFHDKTKKMPYDVFDFELECLGNPSLVAELSGFLPRLPPVTEHAGTAVAHTLLAFRDSKLSHGTLLSLTRTLLGADYAYDPDQVIQDDEQRRKQMPADLAARVMELFTNASMNMLAREWYIRSSNLIIYVNTQLLRLCIMRFLVWMHPLVAQAAALEGSERLATIDRAVIDVTYRVAREFEHHSGLWDKIEQAFVDAGFESPDHSTSLVRWLAAS